MTAGDSSLPSRSVPLRIAPIIHGAASAVLCLPVLAPASALAAAHGEDTPLNLPADLNFSALFHGIDERVPVESLKFGIRVLDLFLLSA